MAISDNYTPLKQLGNGVTTQFSASWAVLSSSYIRVYLEAVATGVQTLQTLGTHYTLAFTNAGFTVTFLSAPTSANYVVIGREIALDQTNPFGTSKGFQGQVHEDALDKAMAAVQDVGDIQKRTPKAPLGWSGDMAMEAPADGKGQYWDNAAQKWKNASTSTESIITTAAASATAAAGSATSASSSASAASASATAAAGSATSASTSATAAQNAAASINATAASSWYVSAGDVGGTANTITLANLPTLVDGMMFRFVPKFTNTASVSVNGSFLRDARSGLDLIAGDLRVDKPCQIVWSAGAWHLVTTGRILFSNGSAASPAMTFIDDIDSGIFSRAPNVLSVATGGTESVAIANGILAIFGTSSTSAVVSLYEDTDNGTNSISIKAPASIAADRTQNLPDRDGHIPVHPSEAIQFAAVTFNAVGTIESQTGPILSVTDTGATATWRIRLSGTFTKVFATYSWKAGNRTESYTVDQYAQGVDSGNSYVDIESQRYSAGASDFSRCTAMFFLVA